MCNLNDASLGVEVRRPHLLHPRCYPFDLCRRSLHVGLVLLVSSPEALFQQSTPGSQPRLTNPAPSSRAIRVSYPCSCAFNRFSRPTPTAPSGMPESPPTSLSAVPHQTVRLLTRAVVRRKFARCAAWRCPRSCTGPDGRRTAESVKRKCLVVSSPGSCSTPKCERCVSLAPSGAMKEKGSSST